MISIMDPDTEINAIIVILRERQWMGMNALDGMSRHQCKGDIAKFAVTIPGHGGEYHITCLRH